MTNHNINYYIGDLPFSANQFSSVAIDTETMGLNLNRDRLCVVQLGFENGDCHVVKMKNDYNCPNLKKLLANKQVLKIFHFGRFDIVAIKKYLGIDCFPVYCTKIASKLCRTNTDSHGLAHLCRDLLEIELSKQQQTSDWGGETLTKEQLEYAANDVLYLHKLKEKLDLLLKREGRFEIAQKCFEFLPYRSELDDLGFDFDIFAH